MAPTGPASAAASPGLRSSAARGEAMEQPPACAARANARSRGDGEHHRCLVVQQGAQPRSPRTLLCSAWMDGEQSLGRAQELIYSPSQFTIALRTSGHLLLGVVRIYHRKAKYLLADCSEALTKMRTAFRPGLVDLPEENFEAAYQSVTLPEEFHDFEAPLPALNAIDVVDHFTLNQSRAEDITFTEGLESSTVLCDRTFDEEPEELRKKSFLDYSTLTSSNSLVAAHCSLSLDGDRTVLQEDTFGLQDGFGDEENAADMIELLLRDEQSDLDKDLLDVREDFPLPQDPPENSSTMEPKGAGSTVSDGHLLNETVLLLREEEGFVLQPVDETAVSQRKKNKRKRKLLVDVVKELSCSTIYNQLNDCTDILTALDLAPPTKKTMMWKEWGGVDKLLSQPGQPVVHTQLQMLFEKCFESHSLKMRRNEIQEEEEVEGTRKEQDIAEMLRAEEPSSLQDPAHPDTGNDLLMLMAQNERNEADGNCGESREGMVCSGSSSLLLPPPGQAAEAQQDESAEELLRNGRESEETRWSKRTLQLLKTLQHLRRSGASSISFQELCRRSSRKEAAVSFCLLLVLKKHSVIQLRQSSPFADITVTPGPLFEAHSSHGQIS